MQVAKPKAVVKAVKRKAKEEIPKETKKRRGRPPGSGRKTVATGTPAKTTERKENNAENRLVLYTNAPERPTGNAKGKATGALIVRPGEKSTEKSVMVSLQFQPHTSTTLLKDPMFLLHQMQQDIQ